MDDFGQDRNGEGILDAILHPIRRIRRLRVGWTRGNPQPLEEDHDRTVMEGESINTDVLQPEHYLVCGHNPRGNPTARCRCGALVCDKCIRRCAGDGDPLCPNCAVMDPETGQTFCWACYDDLAYRRRAAAVGRFFLSLFVDAEDRESRRP